MQNLLKRKVCIIGGGFSGTMTSVYLLLQDKAPVEVILVNSGYPLSKGIAYSSYSNKHLLNVRVKNMSAFADQPNHFLQWLRKHENYSVLDQNLLPDMFLPRNIYGNYLKDVFETAIKNRNPLNSIKFVHDEAIDIELHNNKAIVHFSVSPAVEADKVVLATGNQLTADPNINNNNFYNSNLYYRNPWLHEAVNNIETDKDILIIGNGLTMADVVVGLKEKGHAGKIYSVSTHGFGILPHREVEPYIRLLEELQPPYDLVKMVKIFRKHVKLLREWSKSGESVVDSLRPLTQKIWRSWSVQEKKRFLHHIRHMWGVARHRLPMQIHKQLQQLILDDKLEIIAGRIIAMNEENGHAEIVIKRKKNQMDYNLRVSRVINCTGPLTDITRIKKELFKNLIKRKLIIPDELFLGINAAPEGNIINHEGNVSDILFTIGPNLKGILWESTAVPELRCQAKKLVDIILHSEIKIETA